MASAIATLMARFSCPACDSYLCEFPCSTRLSRNMHVTCPRCGVEATIYASSLGRGAETTARPAQPETLADAPRKTARPLVIPAPEA